jgi:hypothetical protein
LYMEGYSPVLPLLVFSVKSSHDQPLSIRLVILEIRDKDEQSHTTPRVVNSYPCLLVL